MRENVINLKECFVVPVFFKLLVISKFDSDRCHKILQNLNFKRSIIFTVTILFLLLVGKQYASIFLLNFAEDNVFMKKVISFSQWKKRLLAKMF